MKALKVKRGQIYYADLSPVIGSEQGGHRPVLIISNDKGNAVSPIVIIAPITTRIGKKRLPTHVLIGTESGMAEDSMISCEQIRTIDKSRITTRCITEAKPWIMAEVNKAIKISLGV